MSTFDNGTGKISAADFSELILPKQGKTRNEVKTGPAFGVDTAVIDLGNNQGLAISSDPLSLIPTLGLKESAWLSVQLLVNDMATTGFAPMYGQFVLNLPPDLTKTNFEEYWHYIHHFCSEAGVSITGGHTCQIEGQNSTISGGGTMFLTAPLDQIITSDGAEPGDIIIMTKESALISTSILAQSFPNTVKKELGESVYDTACENFYRTSVLQDALIAADCLRPKKELKAMHDVTEGGILGAISEMAKASKCGFRVQIDRIPTGNAQKKVSELFELDHKQIVGAGSMIISVKAGTEEKLITRLNNQGIAAAVVGEFTEPDSGFTLLENGDEKNYQFDGNDPYWGAFFKAFKAGWD